MYLILAKSPACVQNHLLYTSIVHYTTVHEGTDIYYTTKKGISYWFSISTYFTIKVTKGNIFMKEHLFMYLIQVSNLGGTSFSLF